MWLSFSIQIKRLTYVTKNKAELKLNDDFKIDVDWSRNHHPTSAFNRVKIKTG